MARISVPTTARLPSTLRLDPTNPTVLKVFSRLSRPSLLALVLDWLDDGNAPICTPYIRSEEDDDDDDPTDLHPPLHSLAALRELYAEMQTRKGSKREVLDRVLEGDWRHGLTLYQISMADLQYLYDHPTSQRWTAYRVVPLKTPTIQQAAEDDQPLQPDTDTLVVPRFHPSTFLASLQSQALPDVKAHYNFDRPRDMPLLLLRIFVMDSPYNTGLVTAGSGGARMASAATGFRPSLDASSTIYVAFPDGSPYVYLSKPQISGPAAAGEARSLRTLVAEGIPKALSRPRERFGLRPTSLTTRNLHALLHVRGSGRHNTAGGGWSIYADEKKKESPLDTVLPSPPLSEADEGDRAEEKQKPKSERGMLKRPASPHTVQLESQAKRARLVAQARFGNSAKMDDGRGVERVDIVIDDPFPDTANDSVEDTEENGEDVAEARPRGGAGRRSTMDEALMRARKQDDGRVEDEGEDVEEDAEHAWRPSVKLTFQGSHVFAGIRQLVEAGIINGEEMPGWLTGEEGVTIGAVRHGRIRGHKGSGI